MNNNPIGLVVRHARSFYQLVSNRRKFERTPFSGTLRLAVNEYAFETVCTCVDISLRGMGVTSPEQMLTDLIVHVNSDNSIRRLARVRYCQQSGTGFRIGLEFIDS
jgi:hypothetical protein